MPPIVILMTCRFGAALNTSMVPFIPDAATDTVPVPCIDLCARIASRPPMALMCLLMMSRASGSAFAASVLAGAFAGACAYSEADSSAAIVATLRNIAGTPEQQAGSSSQCSSTRLRLRDVGHDADEVVELDRVA